MATRTDKRVVIVGCGPVGAVLALGLRRKGVPVLLLEQEAEPTEDQRAAAIQPSSLEMLEDLGIIDEIVTNGLISPTFHFRDRVTGDLVAEFDFTVLSDMTDFPYVIQYEQYKLVRTILAELASDDDMETRFSCRVENIEQGSDTVTVVMTNEDGKTEHLVAAWVVGCDGFSSAVRQAAGMNFVGFTYPERFIKIGSDYDFLAAGRALCIRNFFSDPDEWCNLFKVNGYGPPGSGEQSFQRDWTSRTRNA